MQAFGRSGGAVAAALRVAAALALLVLAAGRAAALTWGVNGHPINSYPGISFAEQLDFLKELGATSYRVDISSAEAGDRLAALVREGEARGITILPVITPGLDLKALDEKALHAGAYALAKALGTRFRDDIRVWELGNEMENFAILQPCEKRDDGTVYPCEWGPAGGVDALDYYGPRWKKVSAVLRGLSEGMRAADPAIRTAMGTAGWGHTGAFARMKADGIDWDISVWHMYGGDPEWAFKALAAYDRPIWVTEFNHPFGSQKSAAEQADGLVRWMKRLRELSAHYPLEAAHVYELLDETYWAPDFEAYMGLVELNGSAAEGWRPGARKPAYAAVQREIRSGGETAGDARAGGCAPETLRKVADAAFRTASLAYCTVLGRPAGLFEAEDWARRLDGGTSEADMIAALVGAEEFRLKHAVAGLDDRAYIDLLYRQLLGRPADGGGLESYLADIAAGRATRETIARALAQSGEYAERLR